MPAIFISYRRNDSSGHAGALERELRQRFGSENVFLDIEDIHGGQDFVVALGNALDNCTVLIASIGSQWLEAKDSEGRRRLDNPGDYVRMEIAAALKRPICVIPLLVEGATMPAAEQLPDELRALVTRNAMKLSNATWDYDLDQLADQARAAMYSPERAGTTRPPAAPATFSAGRAVNKVMFAVIAMFLSFGLAGFIIGACLYHSTQRFMAVSELASAKISKLELDGDGLYYTQVQFETKNNEPITTYLPGSSNAPDGQVGDVIPVLYEPSHPQEVKSASFISLWGGALGTGAMGVIFAGAAIGMLVYALMRRRRQLDLIRRGRPIMTEFERVEQNPSVKFNGRNPYRVVTRWSNPISGEVVHFLSNDVWDDPTEHVKHRSITVLVDPDRVSHYVMDMSMVPRSSK